MMVRGADNSNDITVVLLGEANDELATERSHLVAPKGEDEAAEALAMSLAANQAPPGGDIAFPAVGFSRKQNNLVNARGQILGLLALKSNGAIVTRISCQR